jgi:hypothetical protein
MSHIFRATKLQPFAINSSHVNCCFLCDVVSNVEITWPTVTGRQIQWELTFCWWTHTLGCLQYTTGDIAFAADRPLICNLFNDAVSTQNIKRRKTGWEWILNWDPRLVWRVARNLGPTEIGSRDRPVHSESLYRLCYPCPLQDCSRLLKFPVDASIFSEKATCRNVMRKFFYMKSRWVS